MAARRTCAQSLAVGVASIATRPVDASHMFQACYLLAVACLVATTVRLPVINVSPSDLFVLGALCLWMWKTIRNRSRHGWAVTSHALWMPGTLVLLGGLISSVHAVQPFTSVAISIKVWFVMTIWVSMTIVIVRRGHLRSALGAFIAAVTVSSLIGIHDGLTGNDWGAVISGRSYGYWGRIDGTTGHPNELGFVTSLAIPLACGMLFENWQHRRGWGIASLLAVSLIVNALGLLGAGSVAGWVSTILSTVILATIAIREIVRRAWPAVAWAVTVATLLAMIGAVEMKNHPAWLNPAKALLDFNLGRVSSTTGPGRLRLMEAAGARISQNPWVGAGMDQTGTSDLQQEQRVTEDPIHNTIVGGWLAGGILAFIGLMWAYAVVLLGALNALWVGVRRHDWVTIAIGASTIGWMFIDQTQPNLSHRYTWMTIGFVFGLGLQVRWSAKNVRLQQQTLEES